MPDWIEILTRLWCGCIGRRGIGLNRHLHHNVYRCRNAQPCRLRCRWLVIATLHAAGELARKMR